VFLSLLHRMILWELTKVFFLALVAITGILLLAGIVAEASQQGLSPTQLLAVIPLLIPSTLPYTLPATTLFATCIVYGRLAGDNEILAIKAAGVNVLKVVWPGMLLGLVLSGITMGLYYRIIPYTHLLMRTMFLDDVKELMYQELKKEKGISHPRLPYSMFVRDVQGHRLIDATFQHRRPDNSMTHDLVIRSREAELEVDLEKRKLIVTMHYGEIVYQRGETMLFERHVEEVELPALWESGHIPQPRDQSWHQLGEHRAMLLDRIAFFDKEREAAEERARRPGAPADLAEHIKNLRQGRETFEGGIRKIDAEYQMRPALALGCLCFVLVGCPVGIWFSRSDYLSAFITCFLPIVFVYYPLMLCGTNYAKEGRFPPLASVWAADVLMALVGVVLLGRLLRN
jgi:lipopolysaccharide export system permease protein